MAMNSVVRPPLTAEFKSKFFKNRPRTDVSTEAPLRYEGLTLGDTLVSQYPGPDEIVEGILEAEERAAIIKYGMRALNLREREIIRARHLTEKPATQDNLGTRY